MKKILKKCGVQRFIGTVVLLVGVLLLALNNFVDTNNVLGVLGILMSVGGLYTWLIKCEKHQFFKLTIGFVLLAALFSWLIPNGYFSGTELTNSGFNRVGLFDLGTYSLLGLYYFTVIGVFLFILGGFYSVLKNISGYKVIVNKIITIFKGKEKIFVFGSMFLYAVLAAFITENLAILIFVPFSAAIAYGLTHDKMLTFVSTFGGILIGIIGSLFSSNIAGVITNVFSVSYTNNWAIKLILFVVAYALMVGSTILYEKKKKKSSSKKDEKICELFVVDKPAKDAKSIGAIITLSIFVLIVVLAYIPWSDAFGLTWATELHKAITEFELFENTVLKFILGTTSQFGSWDLFALSSLMLIFTAILGIVSKIKFDDIIEYFGNGLKNSGRYVVQLLAIYLVVEISIIFPVLSIVTDWIMNIFGGFSYIMSSIAILISSIFGVEFQYTVQFGASYLVGFDVSAGLLSMMYQSIYGLVQFVAPTSAILMLGLSYLEIPYKNWLSYIWKFLVAMLLVIILIVVFKAFVF